MYFLVMVAQTNNSIHIISWLLNKANILPIFIYYHQGGWGNQWLVLRKV
jgi:hypothetical protein